MDPVPIYFNKKPEQLVAGSGLAKRMNLFYMCGFH
jgi:hypothetical protein